MLKYTVKRVLQALIVLWGVYTLTFLVVHMVPGDPVQIMMSKRADPAMMERIREQLGLNRPILAQYVSYLGRALQGELGQSYIKGVPVTQLIGTGFKTTAFVGLTAYGLAILIGLPIGMLAAEHRGRLADRMSIVFSMMMMSVPGFWLAVLLQILFGLKLEWVPHLRHGAGFLVGAAGADAGHRLFGVPCPDDADQCAGCAVAGLCPDGPGQGPAAPAGEADPCDEKCCHPHGDAFWPAAAQPFGRRHDP